MSKLKKEWFVDGHLVPPTASTLTDETLEEALTRFLALCEAELRDGPTGPPRVKVFPASQYDRIYELLKKWPPTVQEASAANILDDE